MIVKVKCIEMIWDNYQAASGKPIVRNLLIDLPHETQLCQIENLVINSLTKKGIKGTYNSMEKIYPYDRLLSIEILPEFKELT